MTSEKRHDAAAVSSLASLVLILKRAKPFAEPPLSGEERKARLGGRALGEQGASGASSGRWTVIKFSKSDEEVQRDGDSKPERGSKLGRD